MRLLLTAAGVTLEDLGGANGTLVNGVRITGAHPLISGDRIQVGPLEFEARIVAAAGSSATAKGPQTGDTAQLSGGTAHATDSKAQNRSAAQSGSPAQSGNPAQSGSGQIQLSGGPEKPSGRKPQAAGNPKPAGGKSPGQDAAGSPAPGAKSDAAGNPDDDIMQWLTDLPESGPKSIYLELAPDATGAAETGEVSLDGTQPFAWPASPPAPTPLPSALPPAAATLPPSAPLSELLNSGKPGPKLPDPNAAGNTRDAAKAAIEIFRHRDK